MKKSFLSSVILICLTITVMSQTNAMSDTEHTAMQQQQTAAKNQPHNHGNLYNMGRGVMNITTCWLEVFRCMVYRNSEVPFWGFVAGAIEGTGLTGMRAFGGVTDFIFLGFDIGSIYDDKFQEFVWNSNWLPVASLKKTRKNKSSQ